MRVILISAVAVLLIAITAHFGLDALHWSSRAVFTSDHNTVRLQANDER